MSQVERFLTTSEEEEIVEAIRLAEKNTSGEIRVHLEESSPIDPFERAKVVFHDLGMDATVLKNGVLFYLAVRDKNFVICGDKGINDLVAPDFWDSTKEAVITQFKHQNFKQGLIDGISMAGEQLKKYFPWSEDNQNELPNEISKG